MLALAWEMTPQVSSRTASRELESGVTGAAGSNVPCRDRREGTVQHHDHSWAMPLASPFSHAQWYRVDSSSVDPQTSILGTVRPQ